MLAIALTATLFAFFLLVGTSFLRVTLRRRRISSVLLAPVVGLAITVICLFTISRMGVPLKVFGVALASGLFLIACFGMWKTRELRFPWRAYLPFVLILGMAIYLSGRPMLKYGFEWLSFCNDDMANYCLGAERFLNHGYFDLPTEDELIQGLDQSQFTWFMHVNGGARTGSELILAWVCSITKLSPHQAFMPVIVGLHLCLVSATGAMLHRGRRAGRTALLGCVLMSVSALSTLGVVYQLIAQVGGLALLAGAIALFYRPWRRYSTAILLRYAGTAGIILAALMIYYPEVTPILGMGFFVYLGIATIRKQVGWRATTTLAAGGGVVALVVLNQHMYFFVDFLLGQSGSGATGNEVQIATFPYYLVPAGIANLWGMEPIIGRSAEPALSVAIAIGFVLLIAGLVMAIRTARRGSAVACGALVVYVLGSMLFNRNAAFGLFKLAMFSQLFLLGTLAAATALRTNLKRVAVLAVVVVLVGNVEAQRAYVHQSCGRGTQTEIPEASEAKILKRFREQLGRAKPEAIVLDTDNVVLAKFIGVYTRGIQAIALSQDFFYHLANYDPAKFNNPWTEKDCEQLRNRLSEGAAVREFKLFDPEKPNRSNRFEASKTGVGSRAKTYVLRSMSGQSLFNRQKSLLQQERVFELTPLNEVENHLVFVHSHLGRSYYSPGTDSSLISFTQLEIDLIHGEGTMSGLGRYLLFEIINPTPTMRVVLDLSCTLKADGENFLPPAAVIGSKRSSLPIIGRGSARVVSEPIRPQMIGGRAYVAIDMGTEGTYFRNRRKGLMRLWGNEIRDDRRQLVGFGRNISVISDNEYAKLDSPSRLSRFPLDLKHSGLEYSGLYEDGWVSNDCWCCLKQPGEASTLVIKGAIPKIDLADDFSNELEVLIDGESQGRRYLPKGSFELRFPTKAGSGKRKVELKFDRVQSLPDPDNRPTAAQLLSIGYELHSEGVATR